jgi:hypothetical protein
LGFEAFQFQGSLWQFLDANAAVFHLAAVRLQADWTGHGKFVGTFQFLAIAGAGCDFAFYDNLDLVPILWLVFFQILVGAGHQVIPALKLWLAKENAAIRIDCGAEFQLQVEVLGKLAGGPKLVKAFAGVYHQMTILGGVSAIAGSGFAIKSGSIFVVPSGKVFAVEKGFETGFKFEGVVALKQWQAKGTEKQGCVHGGILLGGFNFKYKPNNTIAGEGCPRMAWRRLQSMWMGNNYNARE